MAQVIDTEGKQTQVQAPRPAAPEKSIYEQEVARRAAAKAAPAQSPAPRQNAAQEDAAERRSERKAAASAQTAATVAPAGAVGAGQAVPVQAQPVAPVATSTTGAAPQMRAYDQYTQQALGGSPEEAMRKASAAAAQTAQAESDAAIRQSVKGARTAGAMGGQAALAATGVAADAYGQGQARGQQQYFDTTKLGATLGSEMSSRLARGEQTQAGLDMAKMQADAAKAQQKQSMWGNIIGTVGGIASLFSDERLKEDIEPDRLTAGLDAIKGYAYKYKGMPRQEAGVMAQDLEQTNMAPAVMDTPKGKMIDTRRLSTMNTAGLAEHEKRLKDIERMVSSLRDMPAPTQRRS